MRLLAILAFLGFISCLVIHLLVLLGLALLGINLLPNTSWIGIIILVMAALGILIVIAGSFIASKTTKNELWDTGLAVMPEWTKRAVNFFVRYAYISMAVLGYTLRSIRNSR